MDMIRNTQSSRRLYDNGPTKPPDVGAMGGRLYEFSLFLDLADFSSAGVSGRLH